jgi:hypothetical protein
VPNAEKENFMFTIEQLQRRASQEPRAMITPKRVVQANTPEQKREVSRVARKVISDHYAVLTALKDR